MNVKPLTTLVLIGLCAYWLGAGEVNSNEKTNDLCIINLFCVQK